MQVAISGLQRRFPHCVICEIFRSCAVNNYTTPGKKQLAMEFCAYAASKEESTTRVIQNATITTDGSDPFRSSHLDAQLWINQGYEPGSTADYFSNIQESLTSENCATDIRFPSSSEIYALLDKGMNLQVMAVSLSCSSTSSPDLVISQSFTIILSQPRMVKSRKRKLPNFVKKSATA